MTKTKKRTAKRVETFAQVLVRLDACAVAREWVGRKSLETAWAECEREGWMSWLVCTALARGGSNCNCSVAIKECGTPDEYRKAVPLATLRKALGGCR